MTKMTKMTKISGFWALNLKQYRPRSQSPASHKKDLRALFSVAFRANRAGRKVRLFRPCQMCASHLVVNRCTISYVKMCQTIYISVVMVNMHDKISKIVECPGFRRTNAISSEMQIVESLMVINRYTNVYPKNWIINQLICAQQYYQPISGSKQDQQKFNNPKFCLTSLGCESLKFRL